MRLVLLGGIVAVVLSAGIAKADFGFGTPVNLGPNINGSGNGSILYFSSERSGGFGGVDLWQAPILPVLDFNGNLDSSEANPWLSADRLELYFSSKGRSQSGEPRGQKGGVA